MPAPIDRRATSTAGQRLAVTTAVPSTRTTSFWLVIQVRIVQIGLDVDRHDLTVGRDHVAWSGRAPKSQLTLRNTLPGPGRSSATSVQQPGRHTALDDDPTEAAGRVHGLVVVQRVAVAGHRREADDVLGLDEA